MKSLERRVARLEGPGGDDELINIEGHVMTGAELDQILQEVARRGSRIWAGYNDKQS